MTAFDAADDLGEDLGYMLLRDTPVTMFYRHSFLEQVTAGLADHGYQITSLDASTWRTESDLHRDIAQALSFPGY